MTGNRWFWNGDIIFETTGARFIQTVHLTEHAVTGVNVIDNYAERVDIHDLIKTQLFFTILL